MRIVWSHRTLVSPGRVPLVCHESGSTPPRATRCFEAKPATLRTFLTEAQAGQTIICRSLAFDTRRNRLAIGNVQQPTLAERETGRFELQQTHHYVAETVWGTDYKHHNLVGAFISVEPGRPDSHTFLIEIFGASNTFSPDDPTSDKDEHDRGFVRDHLIRIIQELGGSVLEVNSNYQRVRLIFSL